MDVLLCGRGFIGSRIEELLDESVYTLDRGEADYQLDVTEEFSIEKKFDVVIHTIGLAPGLYSPSDYREVHVEGTKNIINGVNAEKVIYISALGIGRVDHSYFHTKKEAEELVKDSGMDYTILRPSVVAGEGNYLLDMVEKFSFTRMFPKMKAEIQPVTLDDLTRVVEASLREFGGETLDIAGPERILISEYARQVYGENGKRCFLVPFPRLPLEKLPGKNLLPGFLNPENLALLDMDNTTGENDAERILEPETPEMFQ
ncbi:MAG: NAD(P)H-binding protein [Candidatus Nanohaloarchaea archaeon]